MCTIKNERQWCLTHSPTTRRTIRHVNTIHSPAPRWVPNTTCNINTTWVYNPGIDETPIANPFAASPTVWQIELHNGPDNRLVKTLINDALKPALQTVEHEWRKERAEGKTRKEKDAGAAALVIVGRLDQEKFFSNGTPEGS